MTVSIWKADYLVNEITFGEQKSTTQTVLDNGNVVVAWVDQPGINSFVKYRIFDSVGDPVTAELTFDHSNDLDETLMPSITALANGGFALTALSAATGGGSYRGLVATYDASGVEQSEIIVSNSASFTFYEPEIVQVGTDLWVAYTDLSTGDIDISRYDDVGLLINTIQANSGTLFYEDVRMAKLDNGDIAVLWSATNGSLYYNIFDSSGSAQFGSDQYVASSFSAPEAEITPLVGGGFVVTWTHSGAFPNGNSATSYKVYSDNGGPYGVNTAMQSFTEFGNNSPNVIGLADGGFMAMWADYVNNIWYVQTFTRAGEPIGSASAVSRAATAAGNYAGDENPQMSLLEDGRVAVSFMGEHEDDGFGIIAMILDPRNGNILDTTGGSLFHGGVGDDRFIMISGSNTAYGMEGNDFFTSQSSTSSDKFYGQSGADRLYGRNGNDDLFGGNDDDRLYGGKGVDDLYGGRGDDLMHGGADFDFLQGGWHDDRLFGDAGADRLLGGDGDDFLYGGDGDDTLEGGFGLDRIEGDAGNDKLVGGNSVDILIGGDDNDTLIGGKASDALTDDHGNDIHYGGEGNDSIIDFAGNNTMFGGSGDDFIQAFTDNQIIFGGSGSDTIFGGNDEDTISGGSGQDVINGRNGNDTITGNGGADFFQFYDVTGSAPNLGDDVITDWANNIDTIILDESLWGGGKTIAQVIADHATNVGADVVFSFGNGDSLTVEGVTNVNWFANDLALIA